jgi:LacI family transcriptional regulator
MRACDGIGVPDVLRHAGLSRSSLEPRFKSVLGRTIRSEIQRVKVERVKELLLETSHPIKWVGEESGLKSPQYLNRIFREWVGMPPAASRREKTG